MVLFRTETAYGDGGHLPEEALAYECFELENDYILHDFKIFFTRYRDEQGNYHSIRDGILCLEQLALNKDKEYTKYFEDYTLAIPLCKRVLSAVEEVTGNKITHLLWLTEYSVVRELYGDNIENPIKDIDAYETGHTVLHDIYLDGTLYAYSQEPKPLSKDFVIKAQCEYEKSNRKGDIKR